MNKKIPTPLAILIIFIVIAAIIAIALWFCPEEETVAPDIAYCEKDADCRSFCGCGCININEHCPGDELVECDGYPCKCVNNKCVEDETADWQTYRNEEYGFEVKYPTGYSVELGAPRNKAVLITENNRESLESFRSFSIHSDESISFEEYLNIRRWFFSVEGGFNESKVTVAGTEGIQLTLKDWAICLDLTGYTKEDLECRIIGVFWLKNDTVYSFEGGLYGEDNVADFLKLSNQILSTLKFLD